MAIHFRCECLNYLTPDAKSICDRSRLHIQNNNASHFSRKTILYPLKEVCVLDFTKRIVFSPKNAAFVLGKTHVSGMSKYLHENA